MAAALLAVVSPAWSADAAETVVRIYPTATVDSDQVKLSDMAALSGAGAELAGDWAITASPEPGRETSLDLDAIQKALIRKGINPSIWVFRGSSSCRISRPLISRATESLVADSSSTPTVGQRLAGQAPTTAPTDAGAAAMPAGPDPNTLEGVIHAHAAARLAQLGGRAVVQMNPALRDLLRLSRPAYDFAITDRSDRLAGLVPFEVTIYRAGKVEQVRSILAEISLVKSVVMAAGPINRGQTIQSDNIVLAEQTFDRPERMGMSDPKAIVGQRAVRFMDRGEMITAKDIEPVPFVFRNDLVTVTVRRGGISIKGVAKALSSASYGESVELRNESSKQVFLATVTGPKTAELNITAGVPSVPVQSISMAGGHE